jgi:hypothetical protein
MRSACPLRPRVWLTLCGLRPMPGLNTGAYMILAVPEHVTEHRHLLLTGSRGMLWFSLLPHQLEHMEATLTNSNTPIITLAPGVDGQRGREEFCQTLAILPRSWTQNATERVGRASSCHPRYMLHWSHREENHNSHYCPASTFYLTTPYCQNWVWCQIQGSMVPATTSTHAASGPSPLPG